MKIKKIKTFCPYCNKKHDVFLVQKEQDVIYKGKKIKYKESLFSCPLEGEFLNGYLLNKNMEEIRRKSKE